MDKNLDAIARKRCGGPSLKEVEQAAKSTFKDWQGLVKNSEPGIYLYQSLRLPPRVSLGYRSRLTLADTLICDNLPVVRDQSDSIDVELEKCFSGHKKNEGREVFCCQ